MKIYRDGMLAGTTPYIDGYFLDAIGSDNAARNYRLVGVTTEGEECPLASYEKGTIHTTDILGIGENAETAFRVYPNPAKDHVTVEGTGILTVTNTLGQIILTKEIDGKTTVELPMGLYFVKLNGITRKIVVE